MRIWQTMALVAALVSGAPAWATSLVDNLVSELGITQDQAIGGAGVLMAYTKQDLDETEWSRLTQLVPEASTLAEEADMGGVMNSLGSVLGDTIGMPYVMDTLSGLGLDPDTIGRFAPTVLDYVKRQGGGELAGALTKLWLL